MTDKPPPISSPSMGDRYYGLVAEGYDVYLADVDFGDRELYRGLIADSGGPALG